MPAAVQQFVLLCNCGCVGKVLLKEDQGEVRRLRSLGKNEKSPPRDAGLFCCGERVCLYTLTMRAGRLGPGSRREWVAAVLALGGGGARGVVEPAAGSVAGRCCCCGGRKPCWGLPLPARGRETRAAALRGFHPVSAAGDCLGEASDSADAPSLARGSPVAAGVAADCGARGSPSSSLGTAPGGVESTASAMRLPDSCRVVR